MSERTLRTPLARVIGLGTAKDGTHHWWMQRLTAVALVPLSIWFVASLVALAGTDRLLLDAWLSRPFPALLMILFLGTGFYHLRLGLQVIIEDYVHTPWLKVSLLMLNSFACVLVGGASILAVLLLLFGD